MSGRILRGKGRELRVSPASLLYFVGVFVLLVGWRVNSSNYSLDAEVKNLSHIAQILGCVILLPLALRNAIKRLGGGGG